MSAEYSVEEVRTVVDGLWARVRPSAVHAEYLRRATSMLTAYAERIEADDRAVPVYQRERDGDWQDLTEEQYNRVRDCPLTTTRVLYFVCPPAQAPQMDSGKVLVHPDNSDITWDQSAFDRLDDAVHDLTGDEGEDDAFTVLERHASWLRERTGGMTLAALLDWYEERSGSPQPTHPHSPDAADSGRVIRGVIDEIRNSGGAHLTRRVDDWADRLEAALAAQGQGEPIPMVLHCPSCGMQHIDAPDHPHAISVHLDGHESRWDNPPHRSHLCHSCGTIWRPADVPTVGVTAINTKGKADVVYPASPAGVPDGMVLVTREALERIAKIIDEDGDEPEVAREIYEMLDAAPSATPEGGDS